MAQKRFHGGRSLLNLPGNHSTAAVVAEIQNSAHPDGDNYPYAVCCISDCDRKVSLEFSPTGNEDTMVNDLHKIDTLISTLKLFRQGLVLEQNRARKRRMA